MLALPVTLLCLATSSSAQPAPAPAAPRPPTAEELSTARQLFDEGLKLEDQGDFAGALANYRRIEKITVSPVLLYRIAVCEERVGHWVEAVNAFDLAALEAEKQQRTDVAAQARTGAQQLRVKIPHLVVAVPADARGVALELDGRPISAALLGTRMLIDPGKRTVVVRAENYSDTFSQVVDIAAGEEKSVRAILGSKKAPVVATTVPTAPTTSASSSSPPPPPADEGTGAGVWVAGGIALGLGAGATVTGLLAHSKHEDYQAANDNPQPGSLQDREALRDEGQSLALVSTVLTGAAAVAAGVTVYLLFSSGPDGPPEASSARGSTAQSSVRFLPWVDGRGGGLVAEGSL